MKVKPAKQKNRVSVEMGQRDADLLATASMKKTVGIKKILVPIDFSKCSLKALTYGIAFAKQFKAAIPSVDMTGSDKLLGNFSHLRAEARDRNELDGEPDDVSAHFDAIR